jgi:integrase
LAEPRRRRHPAATFEQVSLILTGSSKWVFAIFALLAFTGLRVGEAVALRPEDVDLKAGVIHIRRRNEWGPKTAASERDVPVHRRLLAILLAKPKCRGGWFFNSPPSLRFPGGNHHVNPREINVQFQSIAKQAGFAVGRKNQALTLHALRRFFKTCCLDSGVPKPMVDAWLGHSDQSEMDTFYYSSTKSREWIERVSFGEPGGQDLKCINGDNNADSD